MFPTTHTVELQLFDCRPEVLNADLWLGDMTKFGDHRGTINAVNG